MAVDDILAFTLDADGDLVVEEDAMGNQSFATIAETEAIRQNLRQRILSILGERILHPTYGLDFPAIETSFDVGLVRGEVARAISADPDVDQILDIQVEFDGRTRHARVFGTVRLKDDELLGLDEEAVI
jgi:hypothetical protein